MKVLGIFTLIAMFSSIIFGISNQLVFANDVPQVGTIKGEVDYCGSGPKDRIRIYIPGRQFSLITGSDGKFLFDSIPSGTYDLAFEIQNQFIADKKAITVKSDEITDLGRVSICPEMDGKTDESKIPELQIDKDKMGVCREDYQGTIIVINGRAQCDNGKISQLMCNKDFADCDKDINNGCEANLMTDDDNCGICGYICNLEICTLGSC